jgi:oligopeptide/dipeptide ABC transporter ATP-binding protein
MTPVPGDIPSPSERPTGCPFRTRCPEAIPGLCDRAAPPELDMGAGRAVRCHLHDTARAVA